MEEMETEMGSPGERQGGRERVRKNGVEGEREQTNRERARGRERGKAWERTDITRADNKASPGTVL